MANLHKSKSENCLLQLKVMLKKPADSATPAKKCRILNKIFSDPVRKKSYDLQALTLSSLPLLPKFVNNNYDNIKLLTYEGDLWLREMSRLKKPSWRKRRCVLLEDKLHCYETKKGVLTYSGLILRISEIVTLSIEESDCIKICDIDGRTRLFRCNSEDERNEWMTALLSAKAINLVKYHWAVSRSYYGSLLAHLYKPTKKKADEHSCT